MIVLWQKELDILVVMVREMIVKTVAEIWIFSGMKLMSGAAVGRLNPWRFLKALTEVVSAVKRLQTVAHVIVVTGSVLRPFHLETQRENDGLSSIPFRASQLAFSSSFARISLLACNGFSETAFRSLFPRFNEHLIPSFRSQRLPNYQGLKAMHMLPFPKKTQPIS